MKHAYITCPSWLGANSPCSLRDEGYVRSTAATVGRAIGPMAVMTAGMKGCLDRFCMKCCPTNTIYPILRTIHMWRISIESMIWYVFLVHACDTIQWIHMSYVFLFISTCLHYQTELLPTKTAASKEGSFWREARMLSQWNIHPQYPDDTLSNHHFLNTVSSMFHHFIPIHSSQLSDKPFN